jgi:esterase/lipase superfamily enzyme
MPYPYEEHKPYQRCIKDEVLPTDRQWLRMLNDMMGGMSIDGMTASGLSIEQARSIKGLLALLNRYEELGNG